MKRHDNAIATAASQLDEVCSLAARDMDAATLARVRELINVTSERAECDPQWCVIGMLGGTGAGKSTLVNALCGGDVVRAGVLRPTTNEACAVLPRGRAPGQLLQWLGVSVRVEATGALPGDVVVLDLPDIDSIRDEHAQVAARLAARVDCLVVVVNPQKYADARLHEEWLERLRRSHASVTVALTHVDMLDASSRDAIVADLRRILDERGLEGAPIVPVCATNGQGVDVLAAHLSQESQRVTRQAARAQAALREAVALINDSVGLTGRIRGLDTEGMSEELAASAAQLAGAPLIADAVAASTRRAGRQAGGWLPLRWVARLGADPLRRLHLDDESRSLEGATPSLPTRSPSDEASFVNAVRHEVGRRGQGRPSRWRSHLIDRAVEGARGVPAAAHRQVADHVHVSTGAPRAARAFGALQLLAWVACVAGIAWIGVVHAGRASLMEIGVPLIGWVPVPTALALGGCALTLACAWMNSLACRWVASRRRRIVVRDLTSLCREEVERLVVGPVREEDNRQVRIASFIARLSR